MRDPPSPCQPLSPSSGRLSRPPRPTSPRWATAPRPTRRRRCAPTAPTSPASAPGARGRGGGPCRRARRRWAPTSPSLAPRYRLATLRRRLVAIGRAHRAAEQRLDTGHPAIRETLRGIARRHGAPQRRSAALATAEVRKLVAACRGDLAGLRDRALLLLGYAAALRRSELAAVEVEHLRFTADGLEVLLPRSKGDAAGEGARVGVPRGQRVETCPVRAVEAWLRASAIRYGPVFCRVTRWGTVEAGQGLSGEGVRLILLPPRRASRRRGHLAGAGDAARAQGRLRDPGDQGRPRRRGHHGPQPAQGPQDHAPLRPPRPAARRQPGPQARAVTAARAGQGRAAADRCRLPRGGQHRRPGAAAPGLALPPPRRRRRRRPGHAVPPRGARTGGDPVARTTWPAARRTGSTCSRRRRNRSGAPSASTARASSPASCARRWSGGGSGRGARADGEGRGRRRRARSTCTASCRCRRTCCASGRTTRRRGAGCGRTGAPPGRCGTWRNCRRPKPGQRPPVREPGRLRLGFWSADWTPWPALARLRRDWPALRFELRPLYDAG